MKARSAILYPERHSPESGPSLMQWLSGLRPQDKATHSRAPIDEPGLAVRLQSAADALERQRILQEFEQQPQARAQLALTCMGFALHHLDPEISIVKHELAAAQQLLDGQCLAWQGVESRWRVAALTAAAWAQAGVPVQVIHANQAEAQEAWLLAEAFYRALGVNAGLIQPRLSASLRNDLYASGPVHVSISELMLDYLRDRRIKGAFEGEQTQRIKRCLTSKGSSKSLILHGLERAVLVDGRALLCESAMTSVVASDRMELNEDEMLTYALAGIAGQLQEERDFQINPESIQLTAAGRQRLLYLGETLPLALRKSLKLEQQVLLALKAFRQLQPGQDYQLEEGQVVLREGLEGDCTGLKAFLAVREGYRPGQGMAQSGRLSYRRFLQRYRELSALVDRSDDIADEIEKNYSLRVTPGYPVSLPVPDFICERSVDALERLIDDVKQHQTQGGRAIIYAGRTADEALPLLSALDESGVAFDELDERLTSAPPTSLGVLIASNQSLEKLCEGPLADWPFFSLLPLYVKDCFWLGAWDSRPLSHLRPFEQRLMGSGFIPAELSRVQRWLLARAFRRDAKEQRSLRESMMAADEHYRHLLSFTGTGE